MAYTTIDDPSAYFQTTLYSGTGSQQSITNGGNSDLQPDWLWIKERDGTSSHQIMDAVRLYYNRIESNNDSAQLDAGQTGATNQNVTSFDSDGFGVKNGGAVNASGDTYVAWQWKESATAGFDICSWTGNGSAQNISHNLSKVPTMIIVKNRTDAGADWYIYNVHNGNTHSMILNTNTAKVGAYSDNWNNTTPTSSVFTVGSSNSTGGSSSDNMIAYVFTDIKGYSKFGSYTGNGNADGTFVYTGFKPAFIIVKKTNAAEDWELFDNKRLGYNVDNNNVVPNTTSAEATSDRLDIVSNGFKFRTAAGSVNASGDSFIYMAFAENPFTTSTGVPATAR